MSDQVASDELDKIKSRMGEAIDTRAEQLIDVSRQIHAQPELCYEEHFAHRLLTEVLQDEGLAVTREAYDIPTAFAAHAGDEGPLVAVLCEYDALPGIGHACGHNIIAAAGLGAGIAAAALAGQAGGRVLVLGTPAEEGGGGKVKLLDRGAFAGVDAALMVHPADADLMSMNVIAVDQARVTYRGLAAHAAAFPHRGRNALDACVLGYMNVAALRQHLAPGERIHGVITDGGDKPNIVPASAASQWMVRSPTVRRLQRLKERFAACVQAGADAAGCEVTLDWIGPAYADMIHNRAIGERYRANAHALGRDAAEPDGDAKVVASTDMGNVSYAVPSIHPVIGVAPSGTPIHTPDFAGFAGREEGDRAVIDGAKALAWTVADLWSDRALLSAARSEWQSTTTSSR